MDGKRTFRTILWLVAGLLLLTVVSAVAAEKWLDNERQFKSNDAKYNIRRSEHFRIMWGKGAAQNPDENGDFRNCTEQLAQGNLQMLEQVWHLFHDPISEGGMGYDQNRGKSNNPQFNDDNYYRANLMMNNTGIWAGGAWGACDEWGYPLFALPPSYLAFDPPSGATPHEYGHTAHINAGGFNDTPYDGMWHEATSNWVMLQFNNAYPVPGYAVQPYLSLTHGRNYYDAWPLYEQLRETPGYGFEFIGKLWSEANGTKSKGGEYIYDAMARFDTKHGPDGYNNIKDQMGSMAARNVTWDFERGVFWKKPVQRNTDPFSDMGRRGYTELDRVPGTPGWYRVPFAHAPMQAGFNLVQIAIPGKVKGQPYKVNVNFKPAWDPIRRSDMRATIVAVSDNGDARYSDQWNGGINSITLSDDENKVFLAVAATPDFMGYEGFRHPLASDLPLQPNSYEVSFPETKATVFESTFPRAETVTGKAHTNGGGFVADTAKVDATAYVGPNAQALGNAQVLGKARIGDYAVVMGNAVVKDNARVSGHALVKDNAQIYDNGKVRDWATVSGNWKVFENGRAIERCFLMGGGQLSGSATEKGNTCDYGDVKVNGTAVKEYDCANGSNLSKSTLMCWVWGADQGYADRQPDNQGIYAGYTFEPTDTEADKAKLEPDGAGAYGTTADGKPVIYNRSNSIYAHDTYGCVHGYLKGAPKTVKASDPGLGNVLPLNGRDQYVELRRDVVDLNDVTYTMWINWMGTKPGQKVFHFGDSGQKYAYFTPKNEQGKAAFVISNSGKAGEQTLVANSAIPANTWTHIAITLKGDAATLYIDGRQAAFNAKMTLNPDDVLAQNSLAGEDANYIGRGPKGDYFTGLVDDFRAYCMPQEPIVITKLASAVQNKKATIVPAEKDKAPMVPAWLVSPKGISDSSIVMSATRPEDKTAWFEYYFKCTTGNGHDSGWISSNRWTDCELKPGSYSYTVKTRNRDGVESAASAAANVVLAVPTAAPKAQFAYGPIGVSETAVKMTAQKPADAIGKVDYKFARADGSTSGWQASPSWEDKDVKAGSSYMYTVAVRDARGAGDPSEAKSAMARDDAAPIQYKLGEWQTLPYSTVENKISLRAMPVYAAGDQFSIEKDPVEYYFKCVEGGGPDSGWIEQNQWVTPEVLDGKYTYQFKIRDKSPQKNETGWSKPQSATVSNMTGYHNYSVKQLAKLPEGALVSVKGKVTSVQKDHYVVSAEGATCKVVPATRGDQTDTAMNGKEITAKGCWWKVGDEMRVTFSDVK